MTHLSKRNAPEPYLAMGLNLGALFPELSANFDPNGGVTPERDRGGRPSDQLGRYQATEARWTPYPMLPKRCYQTHGATTLDELCEVLGFHVQKKREGQHRPPSKRYRGNRVHIGFKTQPPARHPLHSITVATFPDPVRYHPQQDEYLIPRFKMPEYYYDVEALASVEEEDRPPVQWLIMNDFTHPTSNVNGGAEEVKYSNRVTGRLISRNRKLFDGEYIPADESGFRYGSFLAVRIVTDDPGAQRTMMQVIRLNEMPESCVTIDEWGVTPIIGTSEPTAFTPRPDVAVTWREQATKHYSAWFYDKCNHIRSNVTGVCWFTGEPLASVDMESKPLLMVHDYSRLMYQYTHNEDEEG